MEERAWWTGAAVLGIGLAFALVSALLWASGGRSYGLLKAKLRLGGLLLGLGAVAAGCFDKHDSAMVMCYDAGWDSDSYAQPDIEVDSTELAFGAVAVGTAATQTLLVSNNGPVPLTLSSITLSDDAGVFTITATAPVELATYEQLSIEVVFSPVAPDSYTATLTLVSDDPDHPTLEIAISGGGVAP